MSAHGTYVRYSNSGCRCDDCRAAWAEYCRALRAKRRARLSRDDSRHGMASTYTNHGCRCMQCGAAHSAYLREFNQRRKAS